MKKYFMEVVYRNQNTPYQITNSIAFIRIDLQISSLFGEIAQSLAKLHVFASHTPIQKTRKASEGMLFSGFLPRPGVFCHSLSFFSSACNTLSWLRRSLRSVIFCALVNHDVRGEAETVVVPATCIVVGIGLLTFHALSAQRT